MSSDGLPALEHRLGPYRDAVARRLSEWRGERFVDRLWSADHRIWVPEPELIDRLGWLQLPWSIEVTV